MRGNGKMAALDFPLEAKSTMSSDGPSPRTVTTAGSIRPTTATSLESAGSLRTTQANSATAHTARSAIIHALSIGNVDDQGAVGAPTLVSVHDRTAYYQNLDGLGRDRRAVVDVRPSRLNPGKFEGRIWRLEPAPRSAEKETHAQLLKKGRGRKRGNGLLPFDDADANQVAVGAHAVDKHGRIKLRARLVSVGADYKNERTARRATQAALRLRDEDAPDPMLSNATTPPAPIRLHIVVAWEGFNGLSLYERHVLVSNAVEHGLAAASGRLVESGSPMTEQISPLKHGARAARSPEWPHYSTVGDAVRALPQFGPSGPHGLELTICCATPAAVSPTKRGGRQARGAHGQNNASTVAAAAAVESTLFDRYGANQLSVRLAGQDSRVHVDGHALQRVMLARPPVKAVDESGNAVGPGALPPIPRAGKSKKPSGSVSASDEYRSNSAASKQPGSGGRKAKKADEQTAAQKRMKAERVEKARLRKLDQAWRAELQQAQATIFRDDSGRSAGTPDEAYVKESKNASRRFAKMEHRFADSALVLQRRWRATQTRTHLARLRQEHRAATVFNRLRRGVLARRYARAYCAALVHLACLVQVSASILPLHVMRIFLTI